jgi:hypothetical protein
LHENENVKKQKIEKGEMRMEMTSSKESLGKEDSLEVNSFIASKCERVD